MKRRIIEHLLAVFLVTLALGMLVTVVLEKRSTAHDARLKTIEPYLELQPLDFGSPLHRALFRETLNIFHPNSRARNDSLLQAIEDFREEQFTNVTFKTGGDERSFSSDHLRRLGVMYGQFVLVYLVVMVLSYHAAQSLAMFRFVRTKQHRQSFIGEARTHLEELRATPGNGRLYLTIIPLVFKGFVRAVSYAVLFAPAYVIAYSIRTSFDTGSYLFMTVLAVVSNGLLINSVKRFSTYLMAESRKGYVETAIVKNLNASYAWKSPGGLSLGMMLRPKRLLPTHVFSHIYLNARYQYLPSLKEHASFLITGLIIIEMALNIQGHLGYELLQTILNRKYDVAVSILVGIFLLVKATELVIDVWHYRESAKYENKGDL